MITQQVSNQISTLFIPADRCLVSKVQFSPLSRDFQIEDDIDTYHPACF